MITNETPITPEHRTRGAAAALASHIIRDAHPRTGLVAFLALGEQDLLTALIMHEAHERGSHLPLGAVAARVFSSPPWLLDAEMSISPCAEAGELWRDSLSPRDRTTGTAMLFDLFAQMKSIESRRRAA